MDLEHIDDSETLYRVVRQSDPNGFINGVPTAALFMDPEGTSVERDGSRDENIVVSCLRKRFRRNEDYLNAVKLTAKDCREANTFPNPVNNGRNKFHAEIHDSQTVIPISLGKALVLARICKIIE